MVHCIFGCDFERESMTNARTALADKKAPFVRDRSDAWLEGWRRRGHWLGSEIVGAKSYRSRSSANDEPQAHGLTASREKGRCPVQRWWSRCRRR